MNNDFENCLKEVQNNLFSLDIVQEYFRLKEIVLNDEELKNIEKEMKSHERKMTLNMNDDVIYFQEKKLFEDAKEKIENNPIYTNFLAIQDEIYDLLKEIQEILD